MQLILPVRLTASLLASLITWRRTQAAVLFLQESISSDVGMPGVSRLSVFGAMKRMWQVDRHLVDDSGEIRVLLEIEVVPGVHHPGYRQCLRPMSDSGSRS
jgi:hypothetical protein